MSSLTKSIYKHWKKIPTPLEGGRFESFQFQNTNLWLYKNSDQGFGFFITDTFEKINEKTYKNIKCTWKPKLRDKKRILKHCLVFESTNKINSELFCSSISLLFENNDINKIYSLSEILHALKKIEEITKKEESNLNEIIGAWGELYLINELIKRAKTESKKNNIIEAWEGAETRAIIDFNFKNPKLKIEVKTTTDSIRKHHFNSLEQLDSNNGVGFLASFCVNHDDYGTSCKLIYESIKRMLPKKILPAFEKKIKIRGECCLDNQIRFSISNSREFQFFEFQNVPKPIQSHGVINVEWSGVLENIAPISLKHKELLLELKL